MKDSILDKIFQVSEDIIDTYDHYALLTNACDIARKRYNRAPDSTRVLTNGNIPQEFRLPMEINKDLGKHRLVRLYENDILKKISSDYFVTTISIIDGLLEDIYEIILNHESNLDEKQIKAKVQFREGALPYVFLDIIPNIRGRKNSKGYELEDYFHAYEVLRQIRHAIVHSRGVLQERHLKRINTIEERINNEQLKLSTSGIIRDGKVDLDMYTMYVLRHWAHTFVAFLLVDIDEVL